MISFVRAFSSNLNLSKSKKNFLQCAHQNGPANEVKEFFSSGLNWAIFMIIASITKPAKNTLSHLQDKNVFFCEYISLDTGERERKTSSDFHSLSRHSHHKETMQVMIQLYIQWNLEDLEKLPEKLNQVMFWVQKRLNIIP